MIYRSSAAIVNRMTVNVLFQYKHDVPRSPKDVRLGSGTRHSLVSYISINQTTGKVCKPAVPWITAHVANGAIPDVNV